MGEQQNYKTHILKCIVFGILFGGLAVKHMFSLPETKDLILFIFFSLGVIFEIYDGFHHRHNKNNQ